MNPEFEPQLAKNYRTVLICTGQVYLDLETKLQTDKKQSEIAIIRIEQIAPFPYRELAEILKMFD